MLSQDSGLLVVDKPPGLVVHGGDTELGADLVTRLRLWLAGRGAEPEPYLGVHSRLDVGTSGVLVFTRKREKNADYARAMAQGEVGRVYVAAVSRSRKAWLADRGTLEHQLLADKRRARVVASGGDLARTHYRVLDERGSRALVELRPETGRMHQLRVQLAAVGAPIAGDTLYGGAPAFRLLLHSRRRELLGHVFEAPLPLDFGNWVASGASANLEGAAEKLLDAAALRFPLLGKSAAFRLVNDEGDGLPGIVIDCYGEAAVLSAASDAAEQIAPSLAELLVARGVRAVYLKRRKRQDLRRAVATDLAPVSPIAGADTQEKLVVSEGSLEVQIELADGLSTGLFVDQRDNRERVRVAASGLKVLNLFSYTCTFSVAAALGGASRVTSVDLAGRALERGRANFRLNGLDPEAHEFIQTDAVRFVRQGVKRGQRFGLIVLDPPSFATVGRGTFRIEHDYLELMTDAVRLLAPGGRIFCVTNHQKTSPEAFRRLLLRAAEQARVTLTVRDLPSGLDCPDSPSGPFPSKSLLGRLE